MDPRPLKVIYHEAYLIDYPTASCEMPQRVQSIMDVLSRHYEIIEPLPAEDEDILMVHTRSILKSVKSDRDLFEAASMAAGGAIMAGRLASDGQPSFGMLPGDILLSTHFFTKLLLSPEPVNFTLPGHLSPLYIILVCPKQLFYISKAY
jgi:hypothetical protein